ncbi:hypothetical protein [Actinocrispum wychmicini]|uniref:Uncharacterized protein n=1 Tax=Actinocrispum wychmicini TaxID=1213861 RepID=A0A4R2JCB0_9PSEU|nr:hypothetical protein [Actinocrispum wychmicini]TCO57191.1 hypothetical protein EV192_106668 [Actinocrispum wychmicini]
MTKREREDITQRLAEDITSILDYLSRMLGAADDGSPNYMHDKAYQLTTSVWRLYRRMSGRSRWSKTLEPLRQDPTQVFDPARLRQLVTRQAQHYRAGRALYPAGGDHQAAARRAALESAATALRFGGPKGLDPAVADAIAGWLLARAEREGTPS